MATERLYERIETQVRDLISSGALKPGDKAPSLRRMSQRNRISLSTVAQAYASLERQGLLEARAKSGFYVCHPPDRAIPAPRTKTPNSTPRRVRVAQMLESILSAIEHPDIVSLGVASPFPELLPVRRLARLTTQIVNKHGGDALSGSDTCGVERLRREISYRLAELGCTVRPDELIITNGATEALSIALRSVANPGDIIAVESPTYFFVLRLIERLGMLAVEIKTDPGTGMSVSALEEILDFTDIKAVVAIPNFSNPLGSLMPEGEKERLVNLLAEHDVPLIEDDITGDLGFDGVRPKLAKSYDRADRVLACSSFSKTLAPGYRVGWLAPGRYFNEAFHWKTALSASTAALPQLVVAEFLRSGGYDTFIATLARTYQRQEELMRTAIATSFPQGTRVTRPQGGCVAWIELPHGVDTSAAFAQALEQNVSYVPGMLFSPTRRYRSHLRLACARLWTDEIEGAVRRLGAMFCSLAQNR